MSIARHLPPVHGRHLVQPGRQGLPFIESGGAASARLDLFSGGTFTRSSEAFTQTGAAAGQWDTNDVRRLADFGDGNGQMLLLEGSRAQLIASPRAIQGAGWSAGSSNTPTNDAVASIDGTTSADQQNTLSTGVGQYYTIGNVTGYYSCSMWARMVSGSQNLNFALQNGAAGTGDYRSVAADTTWRRYTASYNCVGGANSYWVPSEGRTIGVLNAQAQNSYQDLHQVEQAAFASSPIRTGSGTRSNDLLTYATGQFPAAFLTRGFQFTFAPTPNNTDFVNHATTVSFFTLLCNGSAGDYIGLMQSGANAYIFVYAANVPKVTAGPITFSANQVLSITANAIAGSATISGAATGNGTYAGTPWSWSAGQTLHVGKSNLNTAFAFGRFGRYVVPL